MPRIACNPRILAIGFLGLCLSAPPCAFADETAQELRCLGTQRSQGIWVPGDVALADPGAAEQYLRMDAAHLVIPNAEAADLEYGLCKQGETQLLYSDQCGLTPKKFIATWQAIAKSMSRPKGRGLHPKLLPLSVDHVEIDRASMAIRWTHLTGTVRAPGQKDAAAQAYFVSSEFTGKCARAQLVL